MDCWYFNCYMHRISDIIYSFCLAVPSLFGLCIPRYTPATDFISLLLYILHTCPIEAASVVCVQSLQQPVEITFEGQHTDEKTGETQCI